MQHQGRRPGLALCLAAVVLATAPLSRAAESAAPAAKAGAAGHWEGAIDVQGTKLGIDVDLAQSGDTWTGDVSIPMQGAKDLPLAGIGVQGATVAFEISGVPGSPRFEGKLEGDTLAGTFTQGGASMPFSLARGAAARASSPAPAASAAPPAAAPPSGATPGGAPQAGSAQGHWEGAIEVPGAKLGVDVDLARSGEAWTGDISIPMQGATDLPLAGIAVQGATVTFEISGVPGTPTFTGKLEGDTLSGTFTQGGASMPFSLARKR